jgi:hypothetical protein
MKPNKSLLSLALAAALMLTGTSAFAGPPRGRPHHHGGFHMMGPAAISGDQQHLYVVACGKIMQYDLSNLKLVKTVDLPKPAPPADLKAKGQEGWGHYPPPPPLGGAQGLWVGHGSLYVLAGPVIYQ